MHGLINTAIQVFLQDSYGPEVWAEVLMRADAGVSGFEAMLHYEDVVTDRLLQAAAVTLARPQATVLEDLGTYLVSHPNMAGLRRLLRFAGVEYEDFLNSLDDLPDRARLAVPELDLPRMELRQVTPCRFTLACAGGPKGFSWVMVGVLRAMADDYGALVTLDQVGATIEIRLVERDFAEGRAFDLGARTG
ncbi:heme NO-binding domain-containing protein [Pseudooceanicola nanhaiensis]|uniref:heme NO-binding domain-containing protein n=1 Tax=Pseudooceanicola nanhaiensis TaxID=375761 RepID=UPI001CD45ADC|nr:heme NO-binding domain-containing protein [Pseudooceanicola nanhaiensis]MCA0920107.1 heme NO-binding domain-containing protein [Pseudooceanicola nanhaiensis]